jgi:hypothetical protein
MHHGLSDQVRAVATEKYVQPALIAGKKQFSVAVKDLMRDLQTQGFPAKNWPQICTALQTERFLRANGLEIEGVDGPPSKLSTTVVVRYRVTESARQPSAKVNSVESEKSSNGDESPEAWAFRVTEKIRGLLKEELAEYGGGQAFLRWVRSEDDENAA